MVEKWDPRHALFNLLQSFPGEIRNHIFEYCIQDAIQSAKTRPTDHLRLQAMTYRSSTFKVPSFNVSVFPRWHGPGVMCTNGIGPLPLLFANKQIYGEVSSLVFSRVDSVSIGGYMVQRQDEDPNIRWAVGYSLLNRQPSLLFSKKVKIRLPRLRKDLSHGYWTSLLHPAPSKFTSVYNTWAVVPGLEIFLRKFKQLSVLDVVLSIEEGDPPNFEGLLPLYDSYGKKMTVEFLCPHPLDRLRSAGWDDRMSLWSFAWEQCLRENGRI